MKSFVFIFCLFFSIISFSQELNCTVIVENESSNNKETENLINQDILDNLKSMIYDFMNSRRWTEDDFETEERINCSLVISITKMQSQGNFQATFQFQSSRTIYGTNYESGIFNFINKDVEFDYNIGQNLDFNENAYLSNLSSTLAFYAYMALAIDYDSFSELGGSIYYTKVLNIVTSAQSSGLPNWVKGKNTNNPYWLSDNANNPQLEKFRKGYYKYHRLAMDQLAEKPTEGQEIIITVLEDIQEVRKTVPVSIFIQSFLMSKDNELINVFKGSSKEIQQKAIKLLQQIDPVNAQKYMRIMQP